MKNCLKRPRSRWMLCLWFTLTGINGHAAEASASARAAVASPASVNDAVAEFWDDSFISEAVAGRLVLRIAGAGLLDGASDGNANAVSDPALAKEFRKARFLLANFIKRIGSERILSGSNISTLTLSAPDGTGFVTVTVAYD